MPGPLDYEEARVERIRVCEPWQSLLGPPDDPGMPVSEEGTSCLVYGRRGYGKSSLLLRLAASVRGSVVWMALEPGMGPGMVKAYAVRMGLELRDSFRIVEPGSLEDMCSALRARKRMLVVTDSVSTFDYPIQAWKAIREATPGAAFFSIVQVNKQGQMGGSEKLAHLCDTIVRVNKSSLSIPQKNRFGPPCSCPTRRRRRCCGCGRSESDDDAHARADARGPLTREAEGRIRVPEPTRMPATPEDASFESTRLSELGPPWVAVTPANATPIAASSAALLAVLVLRSG